MSTFDACSLRSLELALAGDPRGRAEVARWSRVIARRALARYFICREDREDCVQEAAVRALERLSQLREPARFAAWVSVIARHVAFARQRDNASLPLPLGSAVVEVDRPVPTSSPLAGELERAQQRLCGSRQDLLDLRYRQGLSYAEMASRLGVSVPIVRRRLQGARRQLRREVMREMTSPDGKPVSLNRADLDCLFAAASLVDPAADGALCALHLRGRRVFGGTTHRAAAGTLSCRRKLPALALEPARLLQLADHAEASTGCLGWDGESARLALDNGALIECPRLDCSPLNDAAWGLADWPLPHWAEASRAELLELVELIAAAAWGWGAEDDPAEKARAAFTISPNLIGATVFRSERVSFMLGGSIGAKTAPDVAVQFFLNRAYLRDCVAALPASEDRARLEFGEPLQALRFSCPGRPGLATVMMPMKAPEGVSFRVVSSS